jgi:hypothetical protein
VTAERLGRDPAAPKALDSNGSERRVVVELAALGADAVLSAEQVAVLAGTAQARLRPAR